VEQENQLVNGSPHGCSRKDGFGLGSVVEETGMCCMTWIEN